MKFLVKLIVILLFALVSCTKKEKIDSNPNNYLSATEQESFKYSIVRYFHKLPKNVYEKTKFNTEFDSVFKSIAEKSDLYHYYKNSETNETYFAVTRIAPSLKLKKVATIGKLKMENDSIVYYEEICRTWKMEEDELKTKTAMLFEKVLNEEDMSPYFTKNSNPEFYIEFPDDVNYYDVKDRIWKSKP
ncbi:MAG: hypothetical protein ACOVLC_03645 [Flavobacterium sp.]